MTDTKKEKIDPIEFIAMYEKIRQLNPIEFARVNGFIEGINAGFDIAANQQEQKGA